MKFYIKQKVFSLTKEFSIYDEKEAIQYQVSGKFMSLHNKLELRDSHEKTLLRAERPIFSFRPQYTIFDMNDQPRALIKKRFSLFQRFTVEVQGRVCEVEGNFTAHQFQILDQGRQIVSISKKWFTWGDTYEIDIVNENEAPLWLFLVIVIDQIYEAQASSAAAASSSN
ncbi:MAG: LURP-one-related family protein [Candidatus Izemoplasmatales bacterium]|nr:LURP-one-related family protein [Candidatus Izemoplasmatales bacterium]